MTSIDREKDPFLILHSYTKLEMAAYANIDIEDKNFAAKLKKKLTQWGYEYKYSRTKVEITKVPESAEDQLFCLLQKELDLDIRINVKYFAIFFYELCYNPTFVSAPWEVRVNILKEKYDIEISRQTLCSWTKKLIEHNYIGEKTGIITLWKTYYENGEKQREKVEDDEEYKTYLKYKNKIYNETKDWDLTYNLCWKEFKCYYYKVNSIEYNIFGEYNELILDLVDKILIK